MSVTDRTSEQAEFFANRLKKRYKHLWRYAGRIGTNAFRVYHRDIPELPFVVDWYDNHLHVSEYERPHDRGAAEHDAWLHTMIDTASRALTVPRERVFLKRRDRQRGSDQYEVVARRGYTLDIVERELVFRVNLSDYVDTGLFLDHRDLRLYVAKRAYGKRILNLFAYTGGFTVYAAAAGAKSSLTIDLSATYTGWTRDNLKLNGLLAPHHEVRKADVLQEVKQLIDERRRFDIVVLDPPVFSNSKNMRGTWDLQRDHAWLIRTCGKLLAPSGELVFSTHKKRFQFRRDELGPVEIHRLTKATMPEDFRGTNVHSAWSIRNRSGS